MSSIYDEYKDDDGFLYVKYSGENVCSAFLLSWVACVTND